MRKEIFVPKGSRTPANVRSLVWGRGLGTESLGCNFVNRALYHPYDCKKNLEFWSLNRPERLRPGSTCGNTRSCFESQNQGPNPKPCPCGITHPHHQTSFQLNAQSQVTNPQSAGTSKCSIKSISKLGFSDGSRADSDCAGAAIYCWAGFSILFQSQENMLRLAFKLCQCEQNGGAEPFCRSHCLQAKSCKSYRLDLIWIPGILVNLRLSKPDIMFFRSGLKACFL